MLTVTHVLDFFPPKFEEFKLFLISETPCSSRRILVTSLSFSRLSFYWGYRNFRWFFQIALHKASQCSRAHGLQLKWGNCFIRAPVLLACTAKEEGTYWELSLPFIDKCSFASLPEKFSRGSPLPATKEGVTTILTSHLRHQAYCFCSGSTG